MREYKFRGKRIDNGEWVYGYVYKDALIGCNILQTKPCLAAIMVDPSTAGQYTGLHDKNSKEIYEGDIVKLCDTNPILFRVEIILARYGYKTVFKLLDDGTIAQCYFLDKCEVVGNIHDNPELLKEVE
jgi:uncharacterized phage protein (TIGR01671 family)